MDQIVTVPGANIAGMIFSLIVAWVMPIGLCVFLCRRFKAKAVSFFIGCGSFFLFAMILEQLSHFLFLVHLDRISEVLKNNIWLYAMYGGLAAGIFEETGRYLSMRFLMKKNLNRENALMYGAGHGGMEAILILGMTSINNLVISAMLNLGTFEQTLSETADPTTVLASLKPLAALPAWQFFVGGLERIMAMILQIALSVIVYTAVRTKSQRYWFPVAILFHALVDFAVVVVARSGSLVAAEGLTLAGTIVVSVIAYRLWQGDKR